MNVNRARLLVLDDDTSFLEQMPDILGQYGQIDCFRTIDQGLAAVETTFYDVAILDLNFEGDTRTGLDVFKKITSLDRGIDVIMVTGESHGRRLFELANAGIHRFLPKPVDLLELRTLVENTLQQRELKRRAIELSSPAGSALIGRSAVMQKVREQILRLVENGAKDILVEGETGTGKDVVARCIANQADSMRPLITVNCGACNENLIQSELFGHIKGAFTGADRNKIGVFEAAGGGYVFLDEIGDMPISQQPQLLRALQNRKIVRVGEIEERSFNFRVIAATHKKLSDSVEQGTFREDLYYRLSKEKVQLPPLRERLEDLPELVYHFLGIQTKKCNISPDVLTLLQAYRWPGNIRQLEAVVEGMVYRCDSGLIRVKHALQALPELSQMTSTRIKRAVVGTYGMQLITRERQRFEHAIIEANGDRNLAAKILGLPRSTFFRKAKELGLVKRRLDFSPKDLPKFPN